MKREDLTFTSDIRKFGARHILVPVLLVFSVAILLFVTFYLLSIRITAERECRISAENYGSIVSSYTEGIMNLSKNDDLIGYLIEGGNSNDLAYDLYAFVNRQSVKSSFFLLDNSGAILLGSSTMTPDYLSENPPYTTGFMYRLTSDPNDTHVSVNRVGNVRNSSMALSIGKAIVNDGDIVGYLVFEFSSSEIVQYIYSGEVGDIVVTNSFYTSLLSSRDSYTDKYSKLLPELRITKGIIKNEGRTYFVVSERLPDVDARIFIILEYGKLASTIKIACIIGLLILLVCSVALVLASNRIIKHEAGTIDSLMQSILQMQSEGLYTKLAPVDSEFKSLEASYNELLKDIRELVESNRQQAMLRQSAEIRQLESQFNPHFIFNTLEVIRCYIKLDPSIANKMILDLSQLLRYSIDSTKQEVTLKDDIYYIECYLSMLRMKDENRLSYQIDVSDEALNHVVPKLFLQPIVENSVKYSKGIERLDIRIFSHNSDDGLEICVSDNGSGIDGSKLEDIRSSLCKNQFNGKYFGLYNVHKRLRYMFGDDSGLVIESSEKGTLVRLRLHA